MPGQDERYIHVHYTTLRRKDISDRAKLLYSLVGGFWSGEFKASNVWISSILGCSVRSTQRAVAELRDKRLIRSDIIVKDGVTVGRIITLTRDL